MTDFVEAKFKYLACFEEFKWMLYLTNQYLVHENLIRVLFSNATLEQTGQHDQDPCYIMAINAFVMGVPIRVIKGDVATAFDMTDSGHMRDS